MMLEQSIDFDTMKVNMLIAFAIDCSIDFPSHAAYLMTKNSFRIKTWFNRPKVAKLRLAWSLIRCGIIYRNSKFIYTKDDVNYEADLETMIAIILVPVLEDKKSV